jgi:hypothetical protein
MNLTGYREVTELHFRTARMVGNKSELTTPIANAA